MANKNTSMLQIKKALQLLDAGKSKRSVSEQLDISRNTLIKYLEKISLSKQTNGQFMSLSDADFSALIYGEPAVVIKTSRQERFDSLIDYFIDELKRDGVIPFNTMNEPYSLIFLNLCFVQKYRCSFGSRFLAGQDMPQFFALPKLKKSKTIYNPFIMANGITRQLLWEEYLKQDSDGFGYSQFCERLSQLKKRSNNAATMHLEHIAGERMQVDFAGNKMSYVDKYMTKN